MIIYKMQADGGFLAGDTDTGITAYSYPTSPNAVWARNNPETVAADMIARQPATGRDASRDAAWMEELRS